MPEGDIPSSSCSLPLPSQQRSSPTTTQSVPDEITNSNVSPEKPDSPNSSSSSISSQQGDASTATKLVPVETTNSKTTPENVALGSSLVSPPQGSASSATQSKLNGTSSDNAPAPNPISLRDQLRHLGFEHYCDEYDVKPKAPPLRQNGETFLRQKLPGWKKRADRHKNDPVSFRGHPKRYLLLERKASLEQMERIRRKGYNSMAGCSPDEEPSGSDSTSDASLSSQNSPSESSATSPSSPAPGVKRAKPRRKLPRRHQGPRSDLIPQPSTSTTPSDTTSPSPNLQPRAKQVKRKPGLKDLSPARGPSQSSVQPKPQAQSPSSLTLSDTTLPSPDLGPGAEPSPCRYRLKHPTTPSPKPLAQSPPSNAHPSVRPEPFQGSLRRRPTPQPQPSPPTPCAKPKIYIKQGKWSLPRDRSCYTRALVSLHVQFQFHLTASSKNLPQGPKSSHQSPPPSSPQKPPPSPPQSGLERLKQRLSDTLEPKAPVSPLVQAELLYKQHIGTLGAQRSAIKEKLRERARLQKQLEKSYVSQRMLRTVEGAGPSTPSLLRQMRDEATHLRESHFQDTEAKLRKQLSHNSRSVAHMRRRERSLVCAVSPSPPPWPSSFWSSLLLLGEGKTGKTGEFHNRDADEGVF